MNPPTYFDLGQHIGQKALYRANGLSFLVTIENARTNFNVLEFLVRPVAGEGEVWLKASFVTLEDPV